MKVRRTAVRAVVAWLARMQMVNLTDESTAFVFDRRLPMSRPVSPKGGVALLLAGMVFSAATSSQAEITLAPGDKVSLTVIGAGDLDTISIVDAEGFVNLPVIGRVAAQGLTIDQLKNDVSGALSLQPLRLQTADNQSIWFKAEPANVFLSLAEYRPVFLTGHVQMVGAQAFRPGMTVRQALVVAGGIGPGPANTEKADITKLLGERRILQERLSVIESEFARLQSDLAAIDGEVPINASGESETDVSAQWLAAREKFRELNENAADLTLQQMEDRLGVLNELEKVTTETLKTYEEEYQRARELAARGIVPANSVTEAQRSLLSFSTRALETTSEAYRVRTDIARNKERAAAATAEARVDALADMIRAAKEARDIKVRLATLDMQMPLQAGVTPQDSEFAIAVNIYRTTNAEEMLIPAEWDMLVAPGDVIEFEYRPTEVQ
ncbi:polysaccharide biosynthesis/export family protein [Aestuariicoccus sp. MJ-SS9]|uniref:polysaccharide biosynthesis/export family protein n=1 Tax=Aestuariicoccus sp. MJ-SS9 TaxID=3079855 RepID=UPI0029127B0F|nr:polysaccharide biosynthesis/export family protein [Aestuariicoccus sp. MJ-SS9]MDU8911003.1 polysaccharide biosynthesis/export family protein [Aestuariicoccus sp. MJ-SS9]